MERSPFSPEHVEPEAVMHVLERLREITETEDPSTPLYLAAAVGDQDPVFLTAIEAIFTDATRVFSSFADKPVVRCCSPRRRT